MRAPLKAAVLLAAMVLVSFTGVAAQYFEPAVFVNVDEVEGLVGGMIPAGGVENLVVPVRFINIDDARTAISNGFYFARVGGADFTGVVGEWNPGYPWDWPHAMELGVYPPYFDQGIFTNPFTDGSGFAGLTGGMGSGLPADFDGVAYTLTLSDVTGTGPTDAIVMDSTWWLPANYWLWSGVAADVYWGGPYTFDFEEGPSGCETGPFTTCWPQPTILKALENDKILNVAIHCQDPAEVNFSSILVQGKIPPYTANAPYIDGDSIVTDCFIMRFLGSSGFRPIPPEGVHTTYIVTYNLNDGTPMSLTGDYNLNVSVGDVTLDGVVNADDVVFMSEYFWNKGQMCEIEEFMDVDWNGRVDIRDLQKIVELSGL
ncbi:MAG: hypothetical protein JSU74_08550 [Candidatus Zixiibacteriota bacterium]|nr:MAG: hypothetical protein JSU74_08550 [candidate division Zixibacteria bacterium]